MFSKRLPLDLMIGAACLAAGCTQQDQTAKNKGTYIHARHMATGSNIPVPDRGGGSSDTATSDLQREQFQQLQNNTTGHGMGGTGG